MKGLYHQKVTLCLTSVPFKMAQGPVFGLSNRLRFGKKGQIANSIVNPADQRAESTFVNALGKQLSENLI